MKRLGEMISLQRDPKGPFKLAWGDAHLRWGEYANLLSSPPRILRTDDSAEAYRLNMEPELQWQVCKSFPKAGWCT